jgi:hypothetical protein
MRTRLLFGAVLGATLAGFLALSARNQIEAAAEGSFLAHDVYFSLKENSANAKTKMVAACKKYLSKHPGEVFFAAGTRAAELVRSVNDQDFDVALHIVFNNKEAHDQYQDASRHKQFIEENQANWAKVRVFDSMVER